MIRASESSKAGQRMKMQGGEGRASVSNRQAADPFATGATGPLRGKGMDWIKRDCLEIVRHPGHVGCSYSQGVSSCENQE